VAKSNLRPGLIGQTSYPCALFVVRVGRYRLTQYREGEGRADDNAADVTAGIRDSAVGPVRAGTS
jgi:hypothetical protein